MPTPGSQEPNLRPAKPAWAEGAGVERLGRFLLGPELGRGALGRVLRAWDPLLRRELAIKLLLEPDPVRMLRLTQEAQLQAQVEHPGVCRIYEVGSADATPFIAMELLAGPTLGRWAEEATLREQVAVFRQIAEVLAQTHARGLVHLDLKPSNILMEQDSEGRLHPVLLDFGLAREMGNPGLQFKGEGTPAYMSPEQARGDDPGPPSDLFSLGATFFHLLTGRGPEQLPGTPPSGMPQELWPVLRRCLAERPGDRYGSAQALAEDLRRWEEGVPVLAGHPSPLRRIVAWLRRRKMPMLMRAAAFLGLLGSLVWGAAHFRRVRAEAIWAQEMVSKVQDLEATLRVQRMLPPHAVAPDLEKGRALLAEFRARRSARPGFAEGPTAYAIGRGLLALGDAEAAQRELEAAVATGYRTPEAWFALGKATSRVLLRMSTGTERVGKGLAQDAWIKRQEELKAKSREYLDRGQGNSLDPPELQEAMLLLVERQFDPALARARAASVTHPWLYEPLALEGEVHLARAQVALDPASKLAALGEAGEALRRAMAMAPSDQRLREMEVRRCQQAFQLAWASSAPLEPFEAAQSEALAIWERLDADDPLRATLQAQSHSDHAMRLYIKGKDPAAEAQAALVLSDQTLARMSNPWEALQAQAQAYWVLAAQSLHAGGDPAQLFDQALERIRKALSASPGDLFTWDLLSRIHRFRCINAFHSQADPTATFEEAERDLSALPVDPVLGDVRRYHLAMLRVIWASNLQDRGKPTAATLQSAIDDLEAICKNRPADNVAKFHLGGAYLVRGEDPFRSDEERLGDLREAARNYEFSRLANINSFETHWGLVLAAQYQVEILIANHRDAREALKASRQAVDRMGALRPDHWAYWMGKAVLHYQEGKAVDRPAVSEPAYMQALAAIARSQKINPRGRELFLWEAKMHEELMVFPGHGESRRKAALRAVNQVDRLQPGNVQAEKLRQEIRAVKLPR